MQVDPGPLDGYDRIVIWGMGPSLDPLIDQIERSGRRDRVAGIVKQESAEPLYRGIAIIREPDWRIRLFKRVLVINCAASRNREKIARRIRRQRLDFVGAEDFIRAYAGKGEPDHPAFLAALAADLATQRENRQGRFFALREISRFFQRRRRRYPMEEIESSYDDYWIKRRNSNTFSISPSSRYRATIIADLLERDTSLLDIGCGDGTFIKEINSLRGDVHCEGIDLSSVAVEIAQSRGVPAMRQDITVEPIAKVYDYITMMCVLEHVVDAETLVNSLKGRFRRKLFIAIPNVAYVEHRLDLAFFGKTPVTTVVYHMKEHVRFWSHKDFVYWAEKTGFRVSRHFGLFGGIRLLGFHRWMPGLTAANILYELEETRPVA